MKEELKNWMIENGRYRKLDALYASQEISGIEAKNIKKFMDAKLNAILILYVGRDITEEAYEKFTHRAYVNNAFPPTEMRDHIHSYRMVDGNIPAIFCCHPVKPRGAAIMILERDISPLLTEGDFSQR